MTYRLDMGFMCENSHIVSRLLASAGALRDRKTMNMVSVLNTHVPSSRVTLKAVIIGMVDLNALVDDHDLFDVRRR